MKTFYKFLGPKGEAIHGRGSWHLPGHGHAGKWMPKIDNPVLCERGYHVCEEKDILDWACPDCWFVEVRGPEIVGDNKSVFPEGRLLKKTALNKTSLRLFATDCAERASKHITDPELKKIVPKTIQVARAYAFGLVSDDVRKEVESECWRAQNRARDNHWAAAAAARAAAAADAARAARAAADAARAARAAADAADAAERKWQTKRLADYIHGRIDLAKIKAMVEKEKQKGN